MKKNYHFIGIGGIGMSALARILLQKGVEVSGSDIASNSVINTLKNSGAKIAAGHFKENISSAMTVVYSTDISKENPEICAALDKGIPLMHRSELLAALMRDKISLLVTGTHGKTTTSSLLVHVLANCGQDPSFAIGGIVRSLNTNGRFGHGVHFVAEADESDGSFLNYQPYGAIITNIDNDHLNYWKTEEALRQGFKEFAERVSCHELLFWCRDDEQLTSLQLKGIGYGFSDKAELQILSFRQEGWKVFFDLSFQGEEFTDIQLPLIGGHNVLNASVVFGLALSLKIPQSSIREAFLSFQGVARRLDKKGEINHIELYDDYAHHPTEIFATLHAIKSAAMHRRLVVAFQPHRYTRTKDCLDQFPEAFISADQLILTDIYSAGEPLIEGINSETIFKKIRHGRESSTSFISRLELEDKIAKFLSPGDIFVTMGAGDITKVGPAVFEKLKKLHET